MTTAHERDLAYEPDLAYSPLRGYLAAVRRRWWYMVVAVVVTPAVAVAYSLTQPDRYEATAKVLLSRQDVAAALGGTGVAGLPGSQPARSDTARDSTRARRSRSE